MKKIYRLTNNSIKKKHSEVEKRLLSKTDVKFKLGEWKNFYYPVGGNCFYVVGGKVVMQKHGPESLNQKVVIRTRLSKESIYIDLPVKMDHFLSK